MNFRQEMEKILLEQIEWLLLEKLLKLVSIKEQEVFDKYLQIIMELDNNYLRANINNEQFLRVIFYKIISRLIIKTQEMPELKESTPVLKKILEDSFIKEEEKKIDKKSDMLPSKELLTDTLFDAFFGKGIK